MSISDYTDMMPHTVTHEPFSARDGYGAPSYSAGTDYSARVSYKRTLVRAKDGNEVVARGMVWLLGTPAVGPQDRITLPDGEQPPILAVDRPDDELGIHHTKVYFG